MSNSITGGNEFDYDGDNVWKACSTELIWELRKLTQYVVSTIMIAVDKDKSWF